MIRKVLGSALSFVLFFLSVDGMSQERDPSVRTFRESIRVDYGRLGLYSLSGTDEEIGEAIGRLAPRAAFAPETGMVPFMGTFVEKLIQNQSFMQGTPWLKPWVSPFLEIKYYSKIEERISREYQTFIRALADSSGMDRRDATRAFINPDVAQVVAADYLNGTLLPGLGGGQENFAFPANFGCTTFTIPPEYSDDGRIYVGRVQDYAGVGKFDAFPSVYYVKRAGAYGYAQVATAGIAVGTVTAMNEHGLVLTLHTGMTLDAKIENTPGLITTQRMIEGARTIEEAKALCDANVSAAGWIINLVDVATGSPRSAWLELNPLARECVLTFADSYMVTNNHYRAVQNRAREIHVGPSWDQNSPDRGARVLEALEEARGPERNRKLGLREVIQIMADRKDLTLKRTHALAPGAIAAIDQIKAVVFRPETRELWVSDGRSPPSARGRFVHIRMSDFANLENFSRRDASQDLDAGSLLSGTANDLALYPAFDTYLAATLKMDQHGQYDAGGALNLLEQAVALEPQEPLLRLMRGYLYLRTKRLQPGIDDLTRVSSDARLDAHRRTVARFVLAKALDVQGRRAQALQLYDAIQRDKSVYEGLRKAARKYLSRSASLSALLQLNPSSQFFDFSGYD
mgnify:CR=1 FL=1